MNHGNAKTVQLTVRVPFELVEQIDQAAVVLRWDRAVWLRQALRDQLDRQSVLFRLERYHQEVLSELDRIKTEILQQVSHQHTPCDK